MRLDFGIEFKGRKSTCVGREDREKQGRGVKGQPGAPTSLSPSLEKAEAKPTVWKTEGVSKMPRLLGDPQIHTHQYICSFLGTATHEVP